MTPDMFQRRMTMICKSDDIKKVAVDGLNLIDAALGANAHSFLEPIVDYFNRLSVLKAGTTTSGETFARREVAPL